MHIHIHIHICDCLPLVLYSDGLFGLAMRFFTCKKVASALAHLHGHDPAVVHRDIKVKGLSPAIPYRLSPIVTAVLLLMGCCHMPMTYTRCPTDHGAHTPIAPSAMAPYPHRLWDHTPIGRWPDGVFVGRMASG